MTSLKNCLAGHETEPNRHTILVDFGKEEKEKIKALGNKRNVDRAKFKEIVGKLEQEY